MIFLLTTKAQRTQRNIKKSWLFREVCGRTTRKEIIKNQPPMLMGKTFLAYRHSCRSTTMPEEPKVLNTYKEAKEWFWVQEETENRGAWAFIREQFLKHYQQNISYIGRPSSASPATGSHTEHVEELEQILSKALPKT